jgi:hypothetical protein
MKIHFLHLVALCCSILTMGGCTADLSEDSENDLTTDDEELQEGAPNALGADEDTENIGEVSQQVVLKSYSASNTNNALNGANVAKISVSLDGNETVMIGTAGLKGASTQGDTFLRLGAPTGDLIANAVNDDYLCGGSYQLGSRLVYTSSYNVLKSFTIWAGCFANDSCGGTTVVSRRKGHFQYSANNTDHGRQGTTNREYSMVAGRWIRASTCGFAAATAAHNGNTVLRLYRKDGATAFEVSANDDSAHCSAECGVGSTILYQVPSDGYYQVRAGCYGNTACSGTVAVYAE